MVFLGSWPYAHTNTCLYAKDNNIIIYYYVDEDKIVCNPTLDEKLHWIDHQYMIYSTYQLYESEIRPLIELSTISFNEIIHPSLKNDINKTKEHTNVLIITDSSETTMRDIKAVWNSNGFWVSSSSNIINNKTNVKSQILTVIVQRYDIKITGPVHLYLNQLKSVGAIYSEIDKTCRATFKQKKQITDMVDSINKSLS